MDKYVIKNLILVSFIVGIILGIFVNIPFLGMFILAIAFLLVAPLVMVYLIMDSKYELTTINNSIISGAICGFVSSVFLGSTYSIMVALLSKVFHYSNNLILTSLITNSSTWLLFVFIFFISLVSLVTNAFSGLLTYYAINFVRDMYEKKQLEQNFSDNMYEQ